MKEQGVHETPIEQMIRLYQDKLYPEAVVDGERLIRVDDFELSEEVQARVNEIMPNLTAENFTLLGDYQGFKQEFMQLNGFELDGVDYEQEFTLEDLAKLTP
ncbi:paraquat-inducible protein B [Vibrio ishigakensis]|uniref:Paraquat-inducible protein B n=1 Tax=Vibrio ishigakensis TaxID=1481914 RepID=A0A0B8Q6Q0_9VIBR|nr:paraquat-inducible protein B [Vibrio ishigakensis]